jgi:hypothetical protein
MSFVRNPLISLYGPQDLITVFNYLISIQNEFNKHFGRSKPQFISIGQQTGEHYRIFNIEGTPLKTLSCNLLKRMNVPHNMEIVHSPSMFCLQISLQDACAKLFDTNQVAALALELNDALNTFQNSISTPKKKLSSLPLIAPPKPTANTERLFNSEIKREFALQIGRLAPDTKSLADEKLDEPPKAYLRYNSKTQ